jgi:hypothetical protein
MAACPHGRLAARGCVGMAPAYAGLRADRKAVRTDYRPPLDVTGLHLSHPSPACGRGAGGEGQPTHPNASNRAFVHMFYPPLKSPASGGNAVVGMRRSAVESPLAPTAGVHGGAAPRAGWCAAARSNRHWPQLRGSTGAQRPGRGGAPPRPGRTPRAVAARAAGVGLHLSDAWCLADLRGAAPQAPR